MANEAIGMIETKGLVALVQATDAMLKAANVKFVGWNKVGSGLCSVFVSGAVGSVRAAVDAGGSAGRGSRARTRRRACFGRRGAARGFRSPGRD